MLMIAALLLLTNCKKNKAIPSPDPTRGLEYITSFTSQGNSNELKPAFIGKKPGEDSYKIIVSENASGTNTWHGYLFENNAKKEWPVNFNDNYHHLFSQPFLSNDGSLIGNGEYDFLIETQPNLFFTSHKSMVVFKNNDILYATTPNTSDSEIDPYTYTGKQFRNANLYFGFNQSAGFTTTKSFINKHWNYAIHPSGDKLFFIYSKDEQLFATYLNNDLTIQKIDSIACRGYRYKSGCDYGFEEGLEISVLRNGANPYILLSDHYRNYKIFQLQNGQLLEIGSITGQAKLFAYENKLYNSYNNQLQVFDGNSFVTTYLTDDTILGIYGSEEAILIATRKKENTAVNYFDICRYDP